jgi:hypothetical protein
MPTGTLFTAFTSTAVEGHGHEVTSGRFSLFYIVNNWQFVVKLL